MNYSIENLDEHTWLIKEGDGPASVYMYLLEGENKALLIDTGMGAIPLDKICKELTEKPVTVVLTHGHVDHIGSSGLFDDVYMSHADIDLYRLHSGDEIRHMFANEQLNPVKEDDKLLPIEPEHVFDLGGRKLKCIEVPGHTLGCICLLDETRRWLFTGDTCCKAHVLLQMDYNAGLDAYAESIDTLIDMNDLYDITWPGHHTKPVEKEVLYLFSEAAHGLLEGELKGTEVELPMGKSMLLDYKGIGIEY